MIPIQDLISTGLFNLCRCQGLETCRVYPWTQQFVNTISGHDVTRASSFPDLDPSSLPRNAQFSMAAGDFLEVSNSFPILSFKGNSIIYHLVDCWMRSTCIHFALPSIWFLCAQCHILVFFFSSSEGLYRCQYVGLCRHVFLHWLCQQYCFVYRNHTQDTEKR